MNDRPVVRPIQAIPVEHEGKRLIYLKDPLNLATPLGISPVGYFILAHCDGRHSLLDIQEAYNRRFGALLLGDELKSFVAMLDEHRYLESDAFRAYQTEVVDEFRRQPMRSAAHAGGAYKADPAELEAQLRGFFLAPEGPGLPLAGSSRATPKAVVAPHIDFHRGGPAYAWAYKALAESDGADVYVLLGTSHAGGRGPFTLTLKDFETPFGAAETDKDFVNDLQTGCVEDLFADEYLHRGEHSLEFQVVFLKYVASLRAELAGGAIRPFKIVPILVSSFHSMVVEKSRPENSPSVGGFLRVLLDRLRREQRRVCLVAGVDLAHVGREFGDQNEIDESFLEWVAAEDRSLTARLAQRDAEGFFREIAKDNDRRRICGFAPLYSLIHLLDGVRGSELKYSQAFTRETGSAVTFTSMIFD